MASRDNKIEEVSKTVINCESTIDFNHADLLYQHLKNALVHQHEVEINVGAVNKVDVSILQIFLAFSLEAKAMKINVCWVRISDAFRVAVELLGLSQELNLPETV